jgi:hypothetical protein
MSNLAGRTVKTVDDALTVYSERNLSSAHIGLDKGVEIQLGKVSDVDGREWVEVTLLDGSGSFVLGSSVRSHTDIPLETRDIRQEVASEPEPSPPPRPERPPIKPLSEMPIWVQWLVNGAFAALAILAIVLLKKFGLVVLVYGADGIGTLMFMAGTLSRETERRNTLMAWSVITVVVAQVVGRALK